MTIQRPRKVNLKQAQLGRVITTTRDTRELRVRSPVSNREYVLTLEDSENQSAGFRIECGCQYFESFDDARDHFPEGYVTSSIPGNISFPNKTHTADGVPNWGARDFKGAAKYSAAVRKQALIILDQFEAKAIEWGWVKKKKRK